MKGKKCKLRLHGLTREIVTEEFDSIKAAKKWVRECWNRPYTIVMINDIVEPVLPPKKTYRITYRMERYYEAQSQAEALQMFENEPTSEMLDNSSYVERVSVDEES